MFNRLFPCPAAPLLFPYAFWFSLAAKKNMELAMIQEKFISEGGMWFGLVLFSGVFDMGKK